MTFIKRFFKFIWDFIFLFFGMPYEKQAERLINFEKSDPIIRGPKNEQTDHKFHRANKAGEKNRGS